MTEEDIFQELEEDIQPVSSLTLSTIYQQVEKKFNKHFLFDKLQPAGIFITDTWHDFMLPVKTEINADKTVYQMDVLTRYYNKNYLYPKNSVYLPAHYYIEFVKSNFQLFQKRPINYKSLYKPYFTNYITIVIMGNSDYDVYTDKFYRIISDIIINPLIWIRGWRQNFTYQVLNDINDYDTNKGNFVVMMGENFKINLLTHHLQLAIANNFGDS